MESLSPYLGRYVDIHRYDRNFHFAVPFIHSISPDDRDVGSEDGHTRGGPALWRAARNRIGPSGRKGAHAMIWDVCCSHGPVGRPRAVVRLLPRPATGRWLQGKECTPC